MFKVRYEQYWFRMALVPLDTQINSYFYVNKKFFCTSSFEHKKIISVDFEARGAEDKDELKTVSVFRKNTKDQKMYHLEIFI